MTPTWIASKQIRTSRLAMAWKSFAVIGRCCNRFVHHQMNGRCTHCVAWGSKNSRENGSISIPCVSTNNGDSLWNCVAAAPERISRMAKLRERFPVREMTKRGWLARTKDPDELEQEILALARVKRLEDIGASSLAFAAKQTYYGRDLKPAQEAWLWRVRQM